MKKLFYLFALSLFWFSCEPTSSKIEDSTVNEEATPETINLKPYYYPLDSLKDGWVYEYANKESMTVVYYWSFKVVKDEAGDRYLIGVRYNPFFEQDQFSREWIVANGTISKDYKMFLKDSISGKAQTYTAKISENVVFPFEAVQDSVMAYRFECALRLPPDTNVVTKLTRDRKFKEFSTYDLHGEKVDVAVFSNKDYYDIEDTKNGGFWNVEKEVTEIYAKDIGLVYQAEKTVDNTNPIPPNETFLSNIYTMEEFMKLQGMLKDGNQ